MDVLIIGSGAREHAIAYKLKQSKKVEDIYVAPGNAGISQIATCIDINANDDSELLKFAYENQIDLTIVGPEDPLCAGIVDLFEAHDLKIYGPHRVAAELEGSKSFAKEFMIRNDIPTAKYLKTKDLTEAKKAYKDMLEGSIYKKAVIKADGLCAGKGVLVGESIEQGYEFLEDVLNSNVFGDTHVVIEEYLEGIEASLLCFVDSGSIIPMPTAKDHKKIFEGERGPNTGGMGTFSPNHIADAYMDEMMEKVAIPFHKGLEKENMSYRGIIFFGIMLTSEGVKVLEFNTRFGDPETQSILMRLETDLLDIFTASLDDKLDTLDIRWSDKKALTLVLASQGYPSKYEKGLKITGLEDNLQGTVFHAGTKKLGQDIVTNGGRVLSLTALGDTLDEAYEKAYSMADKIDFKGKTFRKDIGPMVKRVYTCKKDKFDLEASALLKELKESYGIDLESIKPYQRYDIEGLTDLEIEKIKGTILSEPPVDDIYTGEEAFKLEKNLKNPLVVQFHKGQYDQREDGLLQSIAVALSKEDVKARSSRVFEISGTITEEDMKTIKKHLINPVDQEEGDMKLPSILSEDEIQVEDEKSIEGFISMTKEELEDFYNENSLAMKLEDLKFFRDYFKNEEKRDPSRAELAIVDTYWSDHCRHTTFNTIIKDIRFRETANAAIEKAFLKTYEDYINMRNETHKKDKPVSLMDMATIMAKSMRGKGELEDLEVSDEINACSVKIKVKVNGEEEDYLLMFKNETHNHPTEIEPFGGASTCLGGAIRDPLSGRSYVYQAMRVTGSADPRESLSETLEGKLPQKKITTEAARGYSSYGNQIGLCTGLVDEVYHDGFKAKRMEVGAVIGAAPLENVKREKPASGDVIVLIGGRTGRDGVGGATGSSKEQTEKSIEISSAEVQKGNAPSERKLQRLFRNEKAAKLIKKCNDFGAGGVSVAIGELADGLLVHLDKVPLKYKGLTPMEIAISESQERMACVLDPKDLEEFLALCHEENIEGTVVAYVTDENRLVMKYKDSVIVDISREFLDSSGVTSYQDIEVDIPASVNFIEGTDISNIKFALLDRMQDLNTCSKKGLVERFDSSIGAGSLFIPLGGKNQLTPSQGMVSLVPSLKGDTTTASIMTYGYNPYLSEESPFHGAYYAVIDSLSKIAAIGGDVSKVRLSFQEYFEKLGEDSLKWGKPFAALLGSLRAQMDLNIPAIGGKDSMSGTYKDLNVPPTLISFAVTTADMEAITSGELKKSGSYIGVISTPVDKDGLLDMDIFKENLKLLKGLKESGKLLSAYAGGHDGLLGGLSKMAIGNSIGLDLKDLDYKEALKPIYGSFIVELSEEDPFVTEIGVAIDEKIIKIGHVVEISLEDIRKSYEGTLESIFPTGNNEPKKEVFDYGAIGQSAKSLSKVNIKISKPNVIIPVFPGSNCEYDSAMAFEKAGAASKIQVFKNLTLKDIDESILELEKSIRSSQILMIPGGFSLGDEPDGSGKFIAAVLRNERIKDAINELLERNDGLILGICNGFQALIKTGLLPYGEIKELDASSPTLTHNEVGRHVAQFVKTKVMSNNSPWTVGMNIGEIHDIPVSHGEGRFIGSEEFIKELYANGQVAFSYVDESGALSMNRPFNPNGSFGAIEGITSPCGKILGKMGHTERVQKGLYKNYKKVDTKQNLFENGVSYFK